MKNGFAIGVLGGMGTYATIHLFQQYAQVFPAEKEWERPRIVIDNRCTMPSRVRAFLFHENVEQLIDEMSESMKGLVNCGCNRVLLACNTSHLFLPQIYEKEPGLKDPVLNIIEHCVHQIVMDGIKEVYLLGSEGTIDSKVYQNALNQKGVRCLVPDLQEYTVLRDCIEAVKQNKYSDDIKEKFFRLMNRNESCILGCTELPILYERYREGIQVKHIYDPIFLALQKIKEEYDNV